MSFAPLDKFLAFMREINPGLSDEDAREAYKILDRFFDDWHGKEPADQPSEGHCGVLEAMTKGELDAYDQGSGEMMAALREILDGKDDGRGVANEPWESLRRRVLSLMQARAADPTSAAHVHTDDCWEPDSGCDMGRNEAYARVADPPGECRDAASAGPAGLWVDDDGMIHKAADPTSAPKLDPNRQWEADLEERHARRAADPTSEESKE